jgi:hypothetical protein
MLIPNKFNGYSRDGIRKYCMGGGGGVIGSLFGGGGDGGLPAFIAPPPPPPPPRMASAAPAPVFETYGQGDKTGSLIQAGAGLRPTTLDYSKPIYDPNYADNITGYQQSSQFYQPVYQQQYQNYAAPQGRMGVSQYGQQPSMMPQMQTPFNPYASQPQMQQMQQPMAQRTSSGPSQAIVSRSAQMRGTPNVMARKAEGGIASLVDNE